MAEPPGRLLGFYWHFARQAKGLFAALFVAGLLVAVLDALIPVFVGRVITYVTTSEPDRLFARFWPVLLSMALVLLVLRPVALAIQNVIANQAIAANVANLVRWQNHWHVARQSWAFFQNDFAGRIANKVMQTGPALRESLVALITGVWYILRLRHQRAQSFWPPPTRSGVAVVLWFGGYAACCGSSCRACGIAPARSRKLARCSPAGSSIPIPTF